MPKLIRPRYPTVIIPDHAWGRYCGRSNQRIDKRTKLKARMESILYGKLTGGIAIVGLKTEIKVDEVKALLALGETGSWVVVSFLDQDMEMKEKRGSSL